MSKIDTIIARLCRRVKVGQIFNWLKFKAHRHDWETVAENRWCLPTRQICTCGAKREVETHPDRMLYRWKYSDGSCGPWLRMTDGQPACIKMVGCGTAYRLPGAGRQPLYTSPQPRQWQGLTREDWAAIGCKTKNEMFVGLDVAAKLREKNTGETKLKEKNNG